jgi:vacuolar-type H+-ATPase subunit I/STV1
MTVNIANPIYDTVFKRMLENERAARFFIGTLLEQEVASVEPLPQEFLYYNEMEKLAVFRLDFVATIVTSTGKRIKVLIEMQKAKVETDLMRFRSYLGEQYKKSEPVNGVKMALPITTIYVLGFTLPEVPAACVKIGRVYEDMVNHTLIESRSPFIEKLTHDSYVVQVDRIAVARHRSKLDKLLGIFEQVNFVDKDSDAIKLYNHDTADEDVKTIIGILHHVATDPVERKKLDDEVEYRRTLEEHFGSQYAAIAEKDEQLKEKDEQLKEKDEAIAKLQERIAQLERKP